MSSDKQDNTVVQPDESKEPTVEIHPQPVHKSGWRGVLSKVLPGKKGAKDKPSPNIYPLF